MFKENKVNSIKPKITGIRTYFYILFFILSSFSANAQCAMCRAALTSEGNTAKAQAVNDGIVYLMVIPYLLVGGIGYYIYRMRKKKKQE
jgi:hypothetical protein